MIKEMSPEERLFNAIQEGKKYPAAKKGESARKKTDLGTIAWKPDSSFFNKILSIVLVVLLAGVVYQVTKGKADLSKINKIIPTDIAVVSSTQVVEPFKPIDVYLDNVQQRDIFRPIPPPEPPKPVAPPPTQPPGPSLEELVKDLKLTGIYEGEETEAIVSDKKSGLTHYLKEGETINNMKVKSILQDRIILEVAGQEVEIL